MRIARQIGSAAALALAAATGCGGTGGDTCTGEDECASGFYCAGPNEPNVCGIPAMESCSADAERGDGQTCHAIADACSADGIGSQCAPPCSSASCGANLRCGALGACEPIPCDEGPGCPAWQTCAPDASPGTPVHARTAGCRDIACAAGGDCPSGTVCVNTICQSEPGQAPGAPRRPPR